MTANKEMIQLRTKKSWDEALEREAWVAPLVDIYETDDDYFLTANMPGVSKENIQIKLEKKILVIMGRIDYDAAANRRYILNESEIGNYYRKFNLSDSIDENRIDARMENGQLILHLPKMEKAKPKNIVIK